MARRRVRAARVSRRAKVAAGRGAASHRLAVAAEVVAEARSRRRLDELAGPVHLGVVWAMYGETGRMVPHVAAHPHGGDFVRPRSASSIG
jgi:hypothetical protein